MAKKKVTGWIGKGDNIKDILLKNDFYGYYYIAHEAIWATKGRKDDWNEEEDWPPKKVTITIEIEEK